MKYLKQLAILLGCYVLGYAVSLLIGERIPSNILGMVILFILLHARLVKLPQVAQTSDFLLQNMAFFFLPALLSILEVFPLMQSMLLQILLICIITTLLAATAAAFTVRLVSALMLRRNAESQGGSHD